MALSNAASRLESDLQAKLEQAVELALDVGPNLAALDSFGANVESPFSSWARCALRTICHRHIQRINDEIKSKFSTSEKVSSGAKWVLKDGSDNLPSLGVDNNLSVDANVESIMSLIDFEATSDLIAAECKAVACRGNEQTARDAFYLFSVYCGDKAEFSGRYLTAKKQCAVDDWRSREMLRESAKVLSAVGQEVDFDFGNAFTLGADYADALSFATRGESGKVFGKGLPVDLTCFAYGWRYRFTPAAVEAIGAYVMLYADEEIQDKWTRAFESNATLAA